MATSNIKLYRFTSRDTAESHPQYRVTPEFFSCLPPLPLTDGYIVFFNPSPVRISRTLSARGEGEVLFFSCNFKQRGLNLIFKTCLTPFTTLEMRRALEPKCIPQLFMGSLLRMRWSAIGQFFPCPQ